MTVPAGRTPYHSYSPGDAMAAEAIPFDFGSADDLVVRVVGGDLLAYGTDYAITGDPESGTASIIALIDAGDDEWELWSETPLEQQLNLGSARVLDLALYGKELDRRARIERELRHDLGRAPLAPKGESAPPLIPYADRTPGYFMGFDADRMLVALLGTTSAGAVALAQLAAGGGAALTGFMQSGTDAVSVSVQTALRELPVSVTLYGAVGDGFTDDGPAIQRAINAHRSIYFPPTAASYRIDTKVTKTLTGANRIDFNHQRITGDSCFELSSATVAVGDLATDAAAGATTVELTSAGSLAAGDLLVFYSSHEPAAAHVDDKTESARVLAVSGTTVTLLRPLRFAWGTADPDLDVIAYRPASLATVGLDYRCQQAQGGITVVRGLMLIGLANVIHYAPRCLGLDDGFNQITNINRVGVSHYYCDGIRIIGGDYARMSYPMGAYGCTGTVRESARGRQNHHTSCDLGNWSHDYVGVVDDEGSYIAWSSHSAWNYSIDGRVENNMFGPGVRTLSNSFDGEYRTTDSGSSTPEFDAGAPLAGYEYIYTGSRHDLRFVFKCPDRTANAIRFRYGEIVFYHPGFSCDTDVTHMATVGDYSVSPNCNFGGFAAPNVGNGVDAGASGTIQTVKTRSGYLDDGFYHINPRRQAAVQSEGWLTCEGPVVRNLAGASPEIDVAIHTNSFLGELHPLRVAGLVTLKAFVVHDHAGGGLGSAAVATFNFFYDSSTETLVFPATPISESGLSGQANESVTIALSDFANEGEATVGPNGDHVIQFKATVANGGKTDARTSLSYELEMWSVETG